MSPVFTFKHRRWRRCVLTRSGGRRCANYGDSHNAKQNLLNLHGNLPFDLMRLYGSRLVTVLGVKAGRWPGLSPASRSKVQAVPVAPTTPAANDAERRFFGDN
jgi:hypothetical protein